MPFTDHSDLYGAINEEGINLVVRHMMQQRPSLFNYGTTNILERARENQEVLCKPIEAATMVDKRENPILSVEDPISVPGTNNNLAVNFLAQVTELQIDFYPGELVTLPPELTPPLAEQHLAIRIQACGGIGCPTKEFLDEYRLPEEDEEEPRQPTVVPFEELECFCLDLVVVGHFKPAGDSLDLLLQPDVDGIEFVDIQPTGLENILECMLLLLIKVVLLPKVAQAVNELIQGPLAQLKSFASLTLVPTPTPAAVPHNPAVEEDQVKLFIDIEEVQP